MATNTTPTFPSSRRDPRQLLNTLKLTINYNDPNIATATFLDSLPAGAVVVETMVEVVTAFNAGTTNTLTVGTNASSYNNLVAAADVNLAVTGVTIVERGQGRSLTSAADTAVAAIYANTGTAPTTGQAIITITFEGGFAT